MVSVVKILDDGSTTKLHSYPSYLDQREHNDVFTDLCASAFVPAHLGTSQRAVRVRSSLVTGNYFATLGVAPALGRLLDEQDDETPGGHPVAVLSFDLRQGQFQRDEDVIGREVTLNGRQFTVVGVAARGFRGTVLNRPVKVWTPMAMAGAMKPAWAAFNPLQHKGFFFLTIFGRLHPQLNLQQARERMSLTYRRLREMNDHTVAAAAGLRPVGGTTMPDRDKITGFMQLLMITVALVLLIACANVANLLMVRADGRQREIAVRLAIGARRRDVVRLFLVESLLISAIGGLFALLASTWITEALLNMVPGFASLSAQSIDLGIDWRVLGFTLLVVMLTGLLFGLVPAIQASRPNLVRALRTDSGATGRGRRRFSLSGMLVIGQVAVTLTLLTCAGLFVRTLIAVRRIDPGFDAQNVLLASVDMARQGYKKARARNFYGELLRRAETMPGVASAALAVQVPIHGEDSLTFDIPGHESESGLPLSIRYNVVSREYFSTMRIPFLRGRLFAPADTEDSPRVAIVNREMATRFWPGGDALGGIIREPGPGGEPVRIVGIVADGKYHSLRESTLPFIYFPLTQVYEPSVTLVARTAAEPMTLWPVLQQMVGELDVNLPLYDAETLEEHLGSAISRENMFARLLSAFGVLALLLFAVGLYGLMSYVVGRRTREYGIRMALGARRSHLLGMVLGHGLALITVGLAIGLILSLAASRAVSSMLYQTHAVDPLTYAGVLLMVVTVALLACYIPARRATRVDPMIALRYE